MMKEKRGFMQKEIEEKAESILKEYGRQCFKAGVEHCIKQYLEIIQGWLTQKPDNENQKRHREWILKLTERLRIENDLED